MFYHQPLFALLDESTSAVSQDVEEELIAACVRELDTTLVTIAHRPHLKKYHQVSTYLFGFSFKLFCFNPLLLVIVFFVQYELHLTKDNEHTFTKIALK